jgi:hypothetical protein
MQITLNIPDDLPANIVEQYVKTIEAQMLLMSKLTTKTAIDLSPLLITEVDAISVRFKEPLELTPYLDEESQQYLVVEEPTLAINAFALNREQLFDEVQEQLVMLWREYACAEASELTIEAQQLKQVLLSKMEYCNAQA